MTFSPKAFRTFAKRISGSATGPQATTTDGDGSPFRAARRTRDLTRMRLPDFPVRLAAPAAPFPNRPAKTMPSMIQRRLPLARTALGASLAAAIGLASSAAVAQPAPEPAAPPPAQPASDPVKFSLD